MGFKIIFEASRTPIYQRIINGFARALQKKHHQPTIVEPDPGRPLEFVRRINKLKPDFIFITNQFGLLSKYNLKKQKYLYELLVSPVIFIHHDNLFGPIYDGKDIKQRLEAFVRISDRSSHFCIENSNISDLQGLSIQNVHKIFHASEFDLIDNGEKYRYDVSFVGHLLPESLLWKRIDPNMPIFERITEDYKKRLERLDYNVEESAIAFANQSIPTRLPAIDWLVVKQIYRAYVNSTTLYSRGKIICDITGNFNVDVIGGDPSYLNGKINKHNVVHAGVHIHAPNKGHKDTDKIYAESRINLNITSTQFDSALVNRVVDIAATGGFVLTDWKDDLKELTSVHELISYRTVDELQSKIEYYLTQDAQRLEIASQLHHEVKAKFTYDIAVKTILDNVT